MKTLTKALWIAALALLLLTAAVQAMSSASYRLDWFVAGYGTGGHASSASYTVDFTVGQAVLGEQSNASHQVGLGFWHGVGEVIAKLFLPALIR